MIYYYKNRHIAILVVAIMKDNYIMNLYKKFVMTFISCFKCIFGNHETIAITEMTIDNINQMICNIEHETKESTNRLKTLVKMIRS